MKVVKLEKEKQEAKQVEIINLFFTFQFFTLHVC
jgi:hypothetical protein